MMMMIEKLKLKCKFSFKTKDLLKTFFSDILVQLLVFFFIGSCFTSEKKSKMSQLNLNYIWSYFYEMNTTFVKN